MGYSGDWSTSMSKNARNILFTSFSVILVAIVGLLLWEYRSGVEEDTLLRIRYGVTPYQDTALPVVAKRLGWYSQAGMDVELVPLEWGEVVNALVAGAVDVAIYNFNSFQPPWWAASESGTRPIFFCPLYVFEGQAIMVHGDDPAFAKAISAAALRPGVSKASNEVEAAGKLLADKRIGVTLGTELEQIVVAALQRAGLERQHAELVHASPADLLAAFLAGDLDAFAAGLTERVESRRHGAKELIVTSDVMMPVVDGLVTTDAFAGVHMRELQLLAEIWFRTIRYINEDVRKRSTHVRDYLATASSTRYSEEEYVLAWSFEVFAKTAGEARAMFSDPSSRFFWENAWQMNNDFLLEAGKISKAVPHEAYWGNTVLEELRNRADQ
jgi:ABC-type nitrate/sulfonate/bicarbonate transport system substrate-binding protein